MAEFIDFIGRSAFSMLCILLIDSLIGNRNWNSGTNILLDALLAISVSAMISWFHYSKDRK